MIDKPHPKGRVLVIALLHRGLQSFHDKATKEKSGNSLKFQSTCQKSSITAGRCVLWF